MLRIWVAAACFASIVGCGATPTSPTDISMPQLRSAPTRIVADGRTLTLTAFLWRDFMPPSPADGRPLQGVLRIATEDGSPVAATVTVDRSWVIFSGDVWAAAVEEGPRGGNTPHYEGIVRDGPKWGPNVAVDVVGGLRGAAG